MNKLTPIAVLFLAGISTVHASPAPDVQLCSSSASH